MTSPTTWDSQREALAIESLRQAGRLRMIVRGESMLPSIWPGDTVHIASASLSDVREGDIVLAYRTGRFFLHRLQTKWDSSFVARGDSMPVADPAYGAENLIGKLASVERAGEVLSVGALDFWSRIKAWLFCHWGPARRLALRLHQRRVPTDVNGALANV